MLCWNTWGLSRSYKPVRLDGGSDSVLGPQQSRLLGPHPRSSTGRQWARISSQACHSQFLPPNPSSGSSNKPSVGHPFAPALELQTHRQGLERRWQPEPVPETGGGGGNGGRRNRKPPQGGNDAGSDGEGFFLSYEGETLNPFSRLASGVKGRLEADPEFAFKLLVECGLDAAIIISVNLGARGERFFKECEFVLCQLCVSLLNDFALVYLLAPTTRMSPMVQGTLKARLAKLPAHVFQRAPYGLPAFTLGQRLACFASKAVQYGAVGFVMGCAGTAVVQGLTTMREQLDPTFVPPPLTQPVLGTGVGWLYFMSLNSNVRYNFVNFAEEFMYGKYGGGPVAKSASVLLRLSNNFFGAYAWMRLASALKLNQPREPRRQREVDELLDEELPGVVGPVLGPAT
ncbi:hypothetical protein WJX72_011423 [[Myrmecia] bisecta]|uniref:Uncharacterized protein n=1 Tax=[Myrmecia] bisecta TaxID=41462 RepID=A0AAW1PC67_9CHLO